jgi:hypothetical protein
MMSSRADSAGNSPLAGIALGRILSNRSVAIASGDIQEAIGNRTVCWNPLTYARQRIT